MVQFKEEKVKKRLHDLGYSPMLIDMELGGVENLHEALQQAFDAWLEGVESDFTFNTLSMTTIMEKRRCDYFNALSLMSLFIKKPEMIAPFLSIPPEIAGLHCGGCSGGEG
jgi:hypothetical protein